MKIRNNSGIELLLVLYDYITTNSFRLVFFMSAVGVLLNILIFHILYTVDSTISSCTGSLSGLSIGEDIIVATIIGPAIETIVFHFLLLELLLFIFKNSNYKYFIVVFISAAIFSLTHRFEAQYLLNAFLGGIILSGSYLIAKLREMIPIVIVFIIHSVTNTALILINRYIFI